MLTLRIGQRIGIGFGLMIAGLVALSTINFTGLQRIGGTYDGASAGAAAATAAAEFDGDLTKDVSALKDYLTTADDAAAQAVTQSMAATSAAAARLKDLTAATLYADDVGEVVKSQASFVAGFDSLHKVVADRAAARETTKAKIGELTTAFTALAEKSAGTGSLGTIKSALSGLATFSSLSTKLTAFIGSGAAVDEAAANDELKNLTDQLVGLKTRALMGGLDAEYDAVDKKMAEFQAAFTAISGATKAQHQQQQSFNQLAGQILDRSAKLRARVAGDVAAANDQLRGTITNTTWLVIVISAATALAAIVLAWVVSRGITRPILAITEVMGRLAERDWAVAPYGIARGDEIGAMAKAVQVFKENGQAADTLQREVEAERASADATRRAEMRRFADQFDQAVGNVVTQVAKAAGEMQALADQLMNNVRQTSSRSASVAEASQQAAGNVQNVAAAAEELSASVQEITRQVASSSEITRKAVSDTARADTQVQSLADAADKIGGVARLISEIAAQTNLLALNATIEAARAGEAGKGFAVVASEVKNLAAQTAKATEEIGVQISAIQSSTNDTVGAIRGIGATIQQVNEITQSVASAIAEQGSATNEIAQSTQQAFSGTQLVAGDVAGMSGVVAASGSAAERVHQACGVLAQQARHLRTEVDRFIEQIRAA
ncbi:MAG TPA: methyl-accepting chemotaxis protein [Dongiaceae bacterium]|nr:methyl-accepting chemotaxis protein [Dongiaceae bacterium]